MVLFRGQGKTGCKLPPSRCGAAELLRGALEQGAEPAAAERKPRQIK